MAGIWHCCDCYSFTAVIASIRPLALELPYAACAALKKAKEKKKKGKIYCMLEITTYDQVHILFLEGNTLVISIIPLI